MRPRNPPSERSRHLAYLYLKRRRDAAMTEGERLYWLHGAQRAMGFADGYDFAIRTLMGELR